MRTITDRLTFPEGPVVMEDGSVLVTEIPTGKIMRVYPNGELACVAETGGGPNGLALGPDGALYVCNNGGMVFHEDGGRLRPGPGLTKGYTTGSIQRVELNTGKVETLYTHCGDIPLRGPNDIVFDRQGGFYFSDLGKNMGRTRDVGGVFYAHPDGSFIEEVIHPIMTPNGVGLSADEDVLYVAETDTCRLWSFKVTAPGKVVREPYPSPNGGKLVVGMGGLRRFDSLALDAEGNICVATLATGFITVVSPAGEVLQEIQFPDVFTTNIAFGGPDMKTAYITLSGTGCLVEMPWERAGLRLNFQRG